MSIELTALTLAALLQFVQFGMYAVPANIELGTGYTMSPRDRDPSRQMSEKTARLGRAFDNHFQALLLFAIAVGVTQMSGHNSATSAPQEQQQAQTTAALRILETTKGVAQARALSNEEQAALLAPWFGTDLEFDALPVPRLIEVIETSEGMDAAGLRLRLAAEVPGAVLDDHSRWREPLVKAASRLRTLGWASILLIAAVTAAMVTLAANAALAANAQVIAVLRLVGATDDYIAQAFIRRFTLRALIGAAVGMVLGMLAVLLMPSGGDETASFLTGLGFQGLHWLLPLLIPPLAAAVAFVATRLAARRTLEGLS